MNDTIVLLTGPVGGGKTTTSVALAEQLRARDRPTGVIDLDVLYPMAQQTEPRYADIATWRIVYRSAAVLAETFFESGLEIVVVEGGFFSAEEHGWLCDYLRSDLAVLLFALDVSWDETLRRVRGDPNRYRVGPPNSAVVRWHYDAFARSRPWLRDMGVVVAADKRTPEELARTIADAVLAA